MHSSKGSPGHGIGRRHGNSRSNACRGFHLSEKEIDGLREKIAEIDAEILRLMAERLSVARRIANLKIAFDLDIRQPEVEKKILTHVEQRANELGVPLESAIEIFRLLIESSVGEQEKAKNDIVARGTAGKCVIYGGAGGMGRIFSETLTAHGFEVVIVRSSGKLISYPDMKNTEIPQDADFAIVSVPMKKTGDVIEKAASDLPGKRIYEICSMKNHLKQAITHAEKQGSEVISMHPMFGPGITSLRTQPMIFCGNDAQFTDDPLHKIFDAEGARVIVIPLESHDKMMSYVLQLTHAVNIIYFTVLSNSGIELPRFESIASPICAIQMKNAGAVASQDPELYYEIQRFSKHLESLYEELGIAQAELIEALASDNSAKFRILMNKGKKYYQGG